MADAQLENTYAEVYAALVALGDSFTIRIPDNVLDTIASKRNKLLSVTIDENKALNEQGLSKDAITMIAWSKSEYWCDTQEEKDEFMSFLQDNERRFAEAINSEQSLKKRLKKLKEQG